MELKEKLESVVELVRKLKDDWASSNPENTDIGIYLHFFRGDEVVVAVQCALDRDAALQAGAVGAMGFSASTMAISFESFHSLLPESPLTGKPWRPQEMQYVSETHPEAIEKDWVYPCLTTTIHERGGGYMLHSESYQIIDGELSWLAGKGITISSDVEGEGGGGYMFDYLQQAMSHPTIAQQIEESAEKEAAMARIIAEGLDKERQEFHSDMATLKTLEERELITAAMFSASEGTLRKELLQERFGAPDPE